MNDPTDTALDLAEAESDKIEAEWQAFLAYIEAVPPEQRAERREAEGWDARFIELQRRRAEVVERLIGVAHRSGGKA